MIYIFSRFTSPRLEYVCEYIFKERYRTDYAIILSEEDFAQRQNVYKVNYSTDKDVAADIHIYPHALLSESDIHQQNFHIHRWKRTVIPFYNQPGSQIPFDIFSAVFFYLSRYEEYLSELKDRHGRFPVEKSISYQYKSLHQPVVDIWLMVFKKMITEKGYIILHEDVYDLELTFDIDLLYKYKYKSLYRKIGATLKDLISFRVRALQERFQVYSGKKKDPFYAFDSINETIKGSGKNAFYFLLMESKTAYDKMHDMTVEVHRETIRQIDSVFPVFIHPSYHSIEQGKLLREKELLESILQKNVSNSRQHFIKIKWPETYRTLIENGITDDYSMGYPQHNGFRAGTSRSFHWFDLKKDQMTMLKIHPFSWMDATALFYNKKRAPREIEMEWNIIHEEVRRTNGIMCPIFHNYILGDSVLSPGYMIFFKKILRGHL